eukprot:GHRR01031720.1.p3 GENE.GHRR01031720.1~~GHRR01031720.1.p3  ORF type:complete len:100 (+),score=28.36 GHRR01031720.1:804-1103(+)
MHTKHLLGMRPLQSTATLDINALLSDSQGLTIQLQPGLWYPAVYIGLAWLPVFIVCKCVCFMPKMIVTAMEHASMVRYYEKLQPAHALKFSAANTANTG